MLNVLYTVARLGRDITAISKAINTHSFIPILKRLGNKAIGRAAGKVLSKLWIR